MSRSGDAAVGMMDSAYFVGRGELLAFFNDLLGLQLTKIEQTASGAVACQLTEYIFPGSIMMSRVNWEAKAGYEFVSNYKLLQAAFNKNNVKRHVDVDKLIRAKYQDNLEFCQWLKAFHDQSGAERENYDPSAVRAKGKGGKKYNDFLQKTASKHGSKALPAARLSNRTRKTKPEPLKPKKPPANNVSGDAKFMKKKIDMKARVEELETSVVEIEKERDFYFEKLRNIEVMLQVLQDKNFEGSDLDTVAGNIFKVLYAEADANVTVGEDGEIVPSNEESSALDLSALVGDLGADENLVAA